MPENLSKPSPPMSESDEKNWCLFSHLTGLSGFIGVPGFIGPLAIWLLKKDQSKRLDYAAKESLNFQLTMLITMAISAPLVIVFGLGFVLMLASWIMSIVFPIIASIKASEGQDYYYPFTVRMIQ